MIMWGWIPNLSGDVCNPDDVQEQIAKFDNDREYRYTCDTAGRNITASSRKDREITSNDKIEIAIHNNAGICSLKITETDIEPENIIDRKKLIGSVWEDFRSMLDSCSDEPCLCTAMSLPIESDASDVEMNIAKRFIDTMEAITDTGSYIEIGKRITPKGYRNAMSAAMHMCNISKTNELYFRRFLDICIGKLKNEKIKENEIELRKLMDARFGKAEIVYEDIMRRSESVSKKMSEDIFRYTLYVTLIAAVVSVVATLYAS